MLDVHDPLARGGTGRTVDWTAAADLAAQREMFLAGGLTPDNVARAIALSGAKQVDVSSGVESAPGVKDAARIRDFINATKFSVQV